MHTIRQHPRLARHAVAALLSVACCIAAPAQAGPKEELQAATKKMLAAKSWHAETTSTMAAGTTTTSVDFAAPDRYRLKTPQGTQTIVGDTMHLSIQGRTMAVPLPKGTLTQWRDPAKVAEAGAKTTVTALGTEAVGGRPAKKYETRNADHPGQVVMMWVGAAGYPVQVRSTSSHQGRPVTTTIVYSRFDDPKIAIAAP